jgi:hypothetical protein
MDSRRGHTIFDDPELQTGTHDFRRPGNDRDFEDARSPRHRDLDIGTHVDIGTHDLTSGTCPLR